MYCSHCCILRSPIFITLDIVVTYVIVFLNFTAHWKTTWSESAVLLVVVVVLRLYLALRKRLLVSPTFHTPRKHSFSYFVGPHANLQQLLIFLFYVLCYIAISLNECSYIWKSGRNYREEMSLIALTATCIQSFFFVNNLNTLYWKSVR